MKKLNLILFSFIILFSLNNKSFSNEGKIIGIAKVIDGDTLKIGSKKIRLYGIDAPEKKQKCKKKYLNINFLYFQKEYNCGIVSKNNLKKKIENKVIKCMYKSKDRYARYLGICYLENLDLNKWMVKNGDALAYKKYSRKYELQEQYAKENKIGIWQGTFLKPEEWRRIMN